MRNYTMILDVAAAVVIGLIGALCFQGSIDGGFVFDDIAAVVNNKDVKQETSLLQLFENDFWGTQLTHKSSHKSYRPFAVLSFRFNVWMSHGELHPRSFHVYNVLLHGLASVLSFPLFCYLFQRRTIKDFKPLIAGILFAIHPIHTEAVAGIVGRADLLCAIFCFLTIIIYTKVVKMDSLSSLYGTILSSCLAGVAMLSKEQGITVLGLCSVYDIIIANSIHPKNVLLSFLQLSKNLKIDNGCMRYITEGAAALTKSLLKRDRRVMLLRQLVLLVSGSLLTYFRCWVMNFEIPNFQEIDNPTSFADNIITRIINYNYIYVLNTWITLCPYWLCFDWSMGCIPLINLNSFDIRIVTIVLFWIIFILLISNAIELGNCSSSRQIIMALSLIVIPFFPASNIPFNVGFVIAERVLYLPSAGFCMLISIGVERLYFTFNKKIVLYSAFIILLMTNISRCHQRSLDWATEKTLFISGLTVCPLNAKVHYNVAKTSFNVTTAVKHYREAIRLNPEYEQALNNLANVLRENGDINESEILLRRAIKIRPDFATAWMNLGIVLSNMKRYDESLESYKTALKHRKKYPKCYYNLGNLYLSQEKYLEAYVAWREATNQKPKHSIAWNNMIVLMDSLGELDRAEELALEALAILPDDSALHFNLANTLGKKSQYKKAEHHFKLAIKLKTHQALYHTNLGVLYHRWKRFKEAEGQYLLALNINPDLKNVEQNLKTVQKLLLKSNYNDAVG